MGERIAARSARFSRSSSASFSRILGERDALHRGADLADHVGVVVVDAGDEIDLGLGKVAVLAALGGGDIGAAVGEGIGAEEVAEDAGALAIDLVHVLASGLEPVKRYGGCRQ